MDYALIILSVALFGCSFAFKDLYRQRIGSSLKTSVQFSFLSGIPGLIALFLINGFRLEFTWFTFLMALIKSVSGICLTFCGFRALGIINLSLYSLFMMLGGMVLPYLQGIIFYGEALTVAKCICFVLICISLALAVDMNKGSTKRKGMIYYVVIFVLNGMSGVISKYFTEAEYNKTSPAGFSILVAITSITISGIALLFFIGKGEKIKHTPLTLCIASTNGVLNRVANLILVITLANGVESSIQYTMVTGGVIVASTAASCFGKRKPSKKELVSAIIAFIAILSLLIPY